MNQQDAIEIARPKRRLRLLLLVLLGPVVLALAIAWLQRREIATGFLDRELARRGVPASYKVTRLGLRTQRLEQVVIGDPARPDATARWVEVEFRYGLGTPSVRRVRIGGGRLYGKVEDGKLRLGALDRLLPAPSGLPFRLPDVDVELSDVGIRLDTPQGRVGLSLEGRGNLADGFDGRLAASSRRLEAGNCRADRVSAVLDIAIRDLKPRVGGPLRAGRLACGSIRADAATVALDSGFSAAIDRWSGTARVGIPLLTAGQGRIARLAGEIAFDGDAAATRGRLDLAAGAGALDRSRTGRMSVAGRYVVGNELAFGGTVSARGVAVDPAFLRPVSSTVRAAAGTPVGPIAESLGKAVERAAGSVDLAGDVRAVSNAGGGIRVSRLSARSASGARLELSGGSGMTYYAGPGRLRIDGAATLNGGGFPDARLVLDQPRGASGLSGTATVAPMTAAGSRLALAPIRFRAEVGATSVDTTVAITGPFEGGSVRDLVIPVSGRIGLGGGFALGARCTLVRFAALTIASLRLDRAAIPLCPEGRALVRSDHGRVAIAARTSQLRLAGTLGNAPVTLAAERLQVSQDRLRAATLAVRLDSGAATHRLDIGRLDGQLGPRGAKGSFSGLSGQLARVPLLVDGGRGQWELAGGVLAVDGGLKVADAAEPARFFPLDANRLRLRLADNRIAVTASLDDPETGTHVADAAIAHDLGSGRGRADLQVPGIAFGPGFQPEQLTRLTTGVVALVDGTVRGRGEIIWGPDGVSSSGSFGTQDMDLAAPFGPVEGLATTIQFADLLGLVSAPGQEASVGLIRTGIDVLDGRIRYQLLSGLRVRVEAGRWPFAGGTLILEETILDFSQESPKRLTFRVEGLDAARFVEQMEFSNIAATGAFDGSIPMVFDQSGGRIVGGHMEARAGGGTLSYIGELTDKDLGAYGKLAFDALKSLRYDRLVIDLDGALDGDFVTRIQLAGVARNTGPQPGLVGMVIKRIAALPFRFNITVRGPFRTLIATARSLEDPTLLIQDTLPDLLRNQPTNVTAKNVQPQESEPQP